MVGHFAQRVRGVLSRLLGAGYGIVDTCFGALPGGVAPVGEDVGDLLGKPAEIVAQALQIALRVGGCVSGGFADFADAFRASRSLRRAYWPKPVQGKP